MVCPFDVLLHKKRWGTAQSGWGYKLLAKDHTKIGVAHLSAVISDELKEERSNQLDHRGVAMPVGQKFTIVHQPPDIFDKLWNRGRTNNIAAHNG